MERRLAAVLMADVVGYSRLIEADEAGTLAALKERRASVFNPTIRSHGGRIVKVMGDGVLVEFTSAVNAVAAAAELQHKMAEANTALPVARRITLRIGINLERSRTVCVRGLLLNRCGATKHEISRRISCISGAKAD